MPKIISLPDDLVNQTVQNETLSNIKQTVIPDPVYYSDNQNGNTTPTTEINQVQTENEVSNINSKNESGKSFHLEKKDTVNILCAIWLPGAFVFVASNLITYYKNIRILNSSLITADTDTLKIYKEACKKSNIKKIPPLYKSKVVKTPLVYGLFRSKILLPDIEIKNEDIYGILTHEIVHYSRRDLYIKFITMFANAIHWFNPLVYIAAKKLMNEMELSCDEHVLKNAGEEQRVSYGIAMLEIVKKCKKSAPSLTTGFNPKRKAVKQRFESILDTAKKKKGYPFILIILCICLLSTSVIGCELQPIQKINKSTEISAELNYEVVSEYTAEVHDIQPLFDMMDNSMDTMGISVLTNSTGQCLIDHNGDIKAELPSGLKWKCSFTFCSICNAVTDHLNVIDSENYEIIETTSGHGGASGHYLYDVETQKIIKKELGCYIYIDNVEFAVVSKARFIGEESDVTEGYTGGVEYLDNGFVFVKDEKYYAAEGYYKEIQEYGIVCNGKLIDNADYTGYLGFDNYGICALEKDGKWGYYNHKGEMVLDHLYNDTDVHSTGDHAQTVPYSSSCGLIALNKNGKWGYADTNGNIIIDFIFQEARPVSHGRAWVKDGGIWKIIEIKNVQTELSSAEAAELLNAYFEKNSEPFTGEKWKLEYMGEKEFYSIPCHSFKVKLYGGISDIDTTKEMIVTFDKTVYDNQVMDKYLAEDQFEVDG